MSTKRNTSHEQLSIYEIGLNREQEAVVSAHFMHAMNEHPNLHLYNAKEFSRKALSITTPLLMEQLLPHLQKASDKFILDRVDAAKIRAIKNFKDYGLTSPLEIGLVEKLTEVMFDRQFLKGRKSNCSRSILAEKIKDRVSQKKPINMIIPALPYKSSSPVKTKGDLPDLSEVNFLLELTEIAKVIDCIYQEEVPSTNHVMASFTIVCDGSRFNNFLNETEEKIIMYQIALQDWIKKLGLSSYINIIDYQTMISDKLPHMLKLEKLAIRKHVSELYRQLILPLLNPYNMKETFGKAIELEPDPESAHDEGRFVPLFKSLIYIVNYKKLALYANVHKKNYTDLYVKLTKHIFEPYTQLTENDSLDIEHFILNKRLHDTPTPLKILEYLRQSMLHEAWIAAISYLTEIRSDRDLSQEPISACFPKHIRWTIHAKPGQFALLTTTALGQLVQPWHGIGVLMRAKNNKIKLRTLPVLLLEGNQAIPVIVNDRDSGSIIKKQPFFYIYPDIKCNNISAFLENLCDLIRTRKN